VPIWHATLPRGQVFEGEYVERRFNTRDDVDREVKLRLGANDATRRAALRDNVALFDLESHLADRTDIFYNTLHLNAVGGEVVARSLDHVRLRNGCRQQLAQSKPMTRSRDRSACERARLFGVQAYAKYKPRLEGTSGTHWSAPGTPGIVVVFGASGAEG